MRVRSSTPYRVATLAGLALAFAGACMDPAQSVAPDEALTGELRSPRAPRRALAPASLYSGPTYLEAFDIYKPEGPWSPDSTVLVDSIRTRVIHDPATGTDSTAVDTIKVKVSVKDSVFWLRPPAIWQPSAPGAALPVEGSADAWFINPFYTPDVRPALTAWAVAKHDKDDSYAMRPMMGWHDASTCAAPPQAHLISSFERSTYLCRNHMMTAVNAKTYGVTYLTPNRMLDLAALGAGGTATVRFDVATLRTTKNDWIDVWVVPYTDNLVTPLDEDLRAVDLQGQPSRGLHIRMTADDRVNSAFKAHYIYDHKAYPLTLATTAGYESKFAQSATVRRRFELRITNTTVSFGMPNESLWWVLDAPLPAPITSSGITKAVVQIGHHSMGVTEVAGDSPTTWHWDNIGLSPSVPFTIINADRRYVDHASAPAQVLLGQSAPGQSHLRFAGYGSKFEVSFNGGGWQKAQRQKEQFDVDGRFHSYWTPVPVGTSRITFRASSDPGDGKKALRWMARDISVWSPNP